ncbi:MAG: hypothetical protein CRN43_18830 [Candidatus Nephrothrix sp. EaCA]|nr:MAG: hypothetical protein CRN43_18830 [Candidatus Nephrothrix sp. EaCA]
MGVAQVEKLNDQMGQSRSQGIRVFEEMMFEETMSRGKTPRAWVSGVRRLLCNKSRLYTPNSSLRNINQPLKVGPSDYGISSLIPL